MLWVLASVSRALTALTTWVYVTPVSWVKPSAAVVVSRLKHTFASAHHVNRSRTVQSASCSFRNAVRRPALSMQSCVCVVLNLVHHSTCSHNLQSGINHTVLDGMVCISCLSRGSWLHLL